MPIQPSISRIAPVLLSFMLALVSYSVTHAQTVVKRASCADSDSNTNFANPLYFHENRSNASQTITMQVIRDGCRPKSPEGLYTLWVVSLGGSGNGLNMTRFGKFTESQSQEVPNNFRAFIRFSTDGKPRGTFDYVYSID